MKRAHTRTAARAVTALAAAALAFSVAPVEAQAVWAAPAVGSFAAVEHGPDPAPDAPTKAGPFTYKQQYITAFRTRGFAGGTLFYPTNGAPGEKFSGIIAMPGYTEPQSVMHTVAKRLASHGFVVFSVNATSLRADEQSRAASILAATEWLKNSREVRDVLDTTSLGVMGHSMGGGGALRAAEQYDYKMVIGLHAWSQRKSYPGITEPVLLVGGSIDAVAPNFLHTEPIYRGLTNARHKAYLNRLGGTHWAALVDDPLIMERIVPAAKEMLDEDFRMTPILCKPAQPRTTWVNTCPDYWVTGPGALGN